MDEWVEGGGRKGLVEKEGDEEGAAQARARKRAGSRDGVRI